MNQIDRNQIIKMLLTILLIFVIVGAATYFHKRSSVTLEEYVQKNSGHALETSPAASLEAPLEASLDASLDAPLETSLEASLEAPLKAPPSDSAFSGESSVSDSNAEDAASENTSHASSLIGALLNGGADGQAMLEGRITYTPGSGLPAIDFYQEPLSVSLQRYITGVSYPAGTDTSDLAIQLDELRYLHILHYDFEGNVTEGELICNQAIAGDLLDIFYELYRNEYQIEKVQLIEEYDGDDTASMEDNNTSCFNYRVVEGSTSLSKHALGLAIDVNPLYNPYITYDKQGNTHVSPETATVYANRGVDFPYKIDENDLCYKLFIQHGFIWGGNWNSVKDYQHFQKAL